MFIFFTGTITGPTTTTTVPPVTVSIIDKNNLDQKCVSDNWAAVLFVLEKDKDPTDAFKMDYILCKTYPDITFSDETLVSTEPPQNCPSNSALVGVKGKKGDKYTWHDPEFVEGICQQVQGWTIDQNNCTTLGTPVHHGSKWQKDEFGTGDEHDWNRYFECPHQTLAIQLVTQLDGSKARYTSVVCCFIEKFSSPFGSQTEPDD